MLVNVEKCQPIAIKKIKTLVNHGQCLVGQQWFILAEFMVANGQDRWLTMVSEHGTINQ